MLRNLFRKLFLCIALGGHSILGAGMSREKIEELLRAMHQIRVEVTVSDGSETGGSSRLASAAGFGRTPAARPYGKSRP